MRDHLAKILQGRQKLAFDYATVSSTSPVEVSMYGQSGLSANYNSSYTPTLNDPVVVLLGDDYLFIIGKVMSGG